jgi:C-terminal processing protease CtpA/Prc
MGKIIISLVIGLVAGVFLSPLRPGVTPEDIDDPVLRKTGAAVACVCDMQRVEELEQALRIERDTNSLLVAEIDQLESEVENLVNRELVAESLPAGDWLQSAWSDFSSDEKPLDRQQLLVKAGFDPIRADWIVERESQLQMAAIESAHREASDALPLSNIESRLAARRALREEIGDTEYEQYLAATGQSTSILVTQVLADSPAQSAGLQVGDEIINYDGTRVFNMIELNDKSRNGDSNQSVVLNIERQGAPMQLVLPRGPLGFSGGKPSKN